MLRKFHFRPRLGIFNVCFCEMKPKFDSRLAKGSQNWRLVLKLEVNKITVYLGSTWKIFPVVHGSQ